MNELNLKCFGKLVRTRTWLCMIAALQRLLFQSESVDVILGNQIELRSQCSAKNLMHKSHISKLETFIEWRSLLDVSQDGQLEFPTKVINTSVVPHCQAMHSLAVHHKIYMKAYPVQCFERSKWCQVTDSCRWKLLRLLQLFSWINYKFV